MTMGTWPHALLWKLGFQFPITSFFWKKILRTVEDEVMPGQACGAVCVCIGKTAGLLLPRMPHLTWLPSVNHTIISLFIGQGRGTVCHPGSYREEPIIQKAPNPSEACPGTTSDKAKSKFWSIWSVMRWSSFLPPLLGCLQETVVASHGYVRAVSVLPGQPRMQAVKETMVDTACAGTRLIV